MREQIGRIPNDFPTLHINTKDADTKEMRAVNTIDGFVSDDFELTNYSPHKPIQMDMAV
jgi:dihydrofolate reductase / thymidylate synthase